MLKLDIDKLCKAIDPSADLDFDYLGIQTLYDRYLVVDKTGEVARRLETPNFFGCVLRWVSLLMKKIQKSKSFLCTTYIKVDDSVHQPLHFLIPGLHIHNSLPAISTRWTILSSQSCTVGLQKMPFYQNGQVDWAVVGRRFVELVAILREPMEKAKESFLF